MEQDSEGSNFSRRDTEAVPAWAALGESTGQGELGGRGRGRAGSRGPQGLRLNKVGLVGRGAGRGRRPTLLAVGAMRERLGQAALVLRPELLAALAYPHARTLGDFLPRKPRDQGGVMLAAVTKAAKQGQAKSSQ